MALTVTTTGNETRRQAGPRRSVRSIPAPLCQVNGLICIVLFKCLLSNLWRLPNTFMIDVFAFLKHNRREMECWDYQRKLIYEGRMAQVLLALSRGCGREDFA